MRTDSLHALSPLARVTLSGGISSKKQDRDAGLLLSAYLSLLLKEIRARMLYRFITKPCSFLDKAPYRWLHYVSEYSLTFEKKESMRVGSPVFSEPSAVNLWALIHSIKLSSSLLKKWYRGCFPRCCLPDRM